MGQQGKHIGSPVLGSIVGQELAVTVLDQALVTRRAAHAYLFSGPSGSGKTDAALSFASGLLCPAGGCNECDTCGRVRRGIHPDVEIITPEGTNILVDQIREINAEVALRPFEGQARCYIVMDAEAMNEQAANAFLKTLEEPPQHVHFILVTDAEEKLLPTIVSRCQRVQFTRLPVRILAGHLVQNHGLPEPRAEALARAAQGNLSYARELATSDDARTRRERVIAWARVIPSGSLADLERLLDEVMELADAEAEHVAAGLDAERLRDLEWAPDARARARVQKAYDKRIRREKRRASTRTFEEVMRVFSYWYRDLAAVSLGADEAVCNFDYLFELQRESLDTRVPAYLEAVGVVRGTEELFRYNVDARCALERMVLSMKEALL